MGKKSSVNPDAPMIIRDRRKGFLWIENSMFDNYASRLQPSSFMVYLSLCRLANNETQTCYPSQTKIAAMVGISDRTVRTALDELEVFKLVKVEKNGRKQTYSLLSIPEKISAIEHHPGSGLPVNSGSGLPDNKTYREQDLNLTGSESTNSVEQFSLSGESEPPKKTDQRHKRFMELIVEAHKYFVKVPPFIDGVTGVNLAKLLKARPDIDEKKFRTMLKNYHNSDDHGRAENPRKYILSLPKYELSALDRFGIEPQVKGTGIGYATA